MKEPIKILIAEDESAIAFLLQSTIKKIDAGMQVVCVENGQEALKIIDKFIPDIFILDWMMPVMGGLELAKILRASNAHAHTPIIMITSASRNDLNLSMVYQSGITDYIEKPFNKLELKLRIKSAVQIARSYRELKR